MGPKPGPSTRERSSGFSLSSSPLTECGENGDRERLRFSSPPLQLSDLGRYEWGFWPLGLGERVALVTIGDG